MKQTRPKIKKPIVVVPEPVRRSLMSNIAGLIREELGSSAELEYFRCDLKTAEGRNRIEWTPNTETKTDGHQQSC